MNSDLDNRSIWYQLLLGCLIAPPLETYVCQQLPYIFLKKRNANNTIIILFSAIFFGLIHCYSIAYIIEGFFVGIVFMKAFIAWKGTLKRKFLITCLIHSMVNLSVTILNLFFK